MKNSPATQITQEVLVPGQGSRKNGEVDRSCELLCMSSLAKTGTSQKYVQRAVEDRRSLQKAQINLEWLNMERCF